MSESAAAWAMALPVATSPVSDTMATPRVGDERGAGGLALAGDDVEHAGRQDVGGDLGEPQRGERRELRRLEHDGVAGRERGADLPRGHVQRVVPRRDRRDDAERVAPDERGVLLVVLAGGAAFEEARAAGEEAQVVDGEVHLELDHADRLADVGDLELAEALHVGVDGVGHLVEHLAALAGRAGGPAGEGVGGGLDRGVDVGGVARRDLGEWLTRRRVRPPDRWRRSGRAPTRRR